MSNCAVIDVTTTVIGIIVAEPTDTPPANTYLVLVPPDLPVMIGYTYVDPYFYDFEGNVVVPYIEVTDGS